VAIADLRLSDPVFILFPDLRFAAQFYCGLQTSANPKKHSNSLIQIFLYEKLPSSSLTF